MIPIIAASIPLNQNLQEDISIEKLSFIIVSALLIVGLAYIFFGHD